MRLLLKSVATLAVLLISWMIAKIIRPIVNLEVKNQDGNLFTPVTYYQNTKTGKALVFISTIHVGNPSYYRSLQQLICGLTRRDYKVLYERIGKINEEDIEAFSPKELQVHEGLQALLALLTQLTELSWLQHQKEGLSCSDPTWVNTDMSYKQLINRLADVGGSFPRAEKTEESFDITEKGILRYLLNKALINMETLLVFGWLTALLPNEFSKAKEVILKERNQIALESVDSFPNEDLILIWGAAHHPGIHAGLKSRGWVEEKKEWVMVYKTRPYDIIKILRAAIKYERCSEV